MLSVYICNRFVVCQSIELPKHHLWWSRDPFSLGNASRVFFAFQSWQISWSLSPLSLSQIVCRPTLCSSKLSILDNTHINESVFAQWNLFRCRRIGRLWCWVCLQLDWRLCCVIVDSKQPHDNYVANRKHYKFSVVFFLSNVISKSPSNVVRYIFQKFSKLFSLVLLVISISWSEFDVDDDNNNDKSDYQ